MIEAFGFSFLRQVGRLRMVQTLEKTQGEDKFIEVRGVSERYANDKREAWKSRAELELTARPGTNGLILDGAVISLSVTLEDDKSLPSELDALDRILVDLGMRSLNGSTVSQAGGGVTRFGLELKFRGAALHLAGYSLNPMLGFWLFSNQLLGLGNAVIWHGSATLQWKVKADDDWSPAAIWER